MHAHCWCTAGSLLVHRNGRSSETLSLRGRIASERYLEKLQLLKGVDPFQLIALNRAATNDSIAAKRSLPPVEATDIVVLKTNSVTAQQFKAHIKSIDGSL